MSTVAVRRVQLPERTGGILVYSGRYTDVIVSVDGRSHYSRIPGHDVTEAFALAQFQRRQQPGFYRVN